MSAKNRPTIKYLHQCFKEESGRLWWLVRPLDHFVDQRTWNTWNAKYAGKEAGCINKKLNRYRIAINNTSFYRYSIVWAMNKCEWCERLDHINTDQLDDKFSNLRPATRSQNGANRGIPRNNTSGSKGVYLDKRRNKWVSNICVNGKTIFLGYFVDKQDAADAYLKGATKYFGEFASDGIKS